MVRSPVNVVRVDSARAAEYTSGMHIPKAPKNTVAKGISLPGNLWDWAKAIAAREGCSVNRVLVEAIKEASERDPLPGKKK